MNTGLFSQLLFHFRSFATHLRPVRGLLICAALLVVTMPLLGAALLHLFQKLVDEVFVSRQTHLLLWFFGAYLLVAGLKFIAEYIDQRLDTAIAENISQAVRIRLYRHIVSVSPGSLGAKNSGELLAYLGGDVDRIASLIYSAPMSLLSNLARIVCYTVFLLLISWKLTLMSLAVVPPLIWMVYRYTPKIRTAARSSRRKSTAWMALAEEVLGARPLVQAFNTHKRETDRFARHADRARKAELLTTRLQAGLALAIEVITMLGSLAVIGVAAYEVAAGRLSVGSVLAFIGAIGFLYGPINRVSQSASRFQRASVSAERLLSLLHQPSLVQDSPTAKALPLPVRGEIEFRDVAFTYPGTDKKVLDGFSLHVAAGEALALVGSSGGGKSSLVRLLLRQYDPDSGSIFFDGINLRDITLASLRDNLAIVLQEAYLLQGSVEDNILYGTEHADAERLQRAARAAHTDEFVTPMPLQYRTAVGPRGERLSGGQRQRIAMARALLRDAPVLILDEATASVDGETENLMQQAVAQLTRQRTLLLVSHRASTLRFVDRIVVLDNGKIIETGTPETLMQPGTRCYELFQSQVASQQTEM